MIINGTSDKLLAEDVYFPLPRERGDKKTWLSCGYGLIVLVKGIPHPTPARRGGGLER